MKKLLIIFLICFSVIACEENNTKAFEKELIVASNKISCNGLFVQQCFLTKEAIENEWEYFYSPIKGFEYEEGFEYKILISLTTVANPPQDDSSIKYTFIKLISRTKKTSENLPN